MTADQVHTISEAVSKRPPGSSITIPKTKLPALPTEFEETPLGTPLWIAHPGATAQYRASPALHAYELEREWKVHRDQFDPHNDPVGHFFFDAPELPIAAAIAGLLGFLAYWYIEKREEKRDDSARRWWLPIAVAAGIAIAAFVVVYIIGALVRGGLAGG